jgi:hypothetical protein
MYEEDKRTAECLHGLENEDHPKPASLYVKEDPCQLRESFLTSLFILARYALICDTFGRRVGLKSACLVAWATSFTRPLNKEQNLVDAYIYATQRKQYVTLPSYHGSFQVRCCSGARHYFLAPCYPTFSAPRKLRKRRSPVGLRARFTVRPQKVKQTHRTT